MKIISCCKIVPEEQDISVNNDKTLKLDTAGLKISLYDLNALEAGVELAAAQDGSTVTALTVGAKVSTSNTKVRKDILSRGADCLAVVGDEALAGILPGETAKIMAGAAKKLGFDLILCGEGSADLYAQQTGLLLGELLGVPTINSVGKITINGSTARVERDLEDEVEIVDVPLPAVLSVTTDINVPKIPSMKAILAASKKPVEEISLADADYSSAPASTMLSILAPDQADRKREIIEGDSEEQIAAFAANIRKILN